MDVEATILTLRAELRQIDEAIFALERVVAGNRPGRGRPPKLLVTLRNLAKERPVRVKSTHPEE